MPTAYSYIRFSTPEQLKGDSLRRQLQRTSDYCKNNNLTLSEKTYSDLGISAFKEKYSELTHPVFNGHIQNLTYPLYLWDGLNEGVFDFDSLGEITKDYIKAHDHLIIEGGTYE